MVELGAGALGTLDISRMVTLPTSLFLMVYIGSMASAARLLHGVLRAVAVSACAASVIVLAFSGTAAVFAVGVGVVALISRQEKSAQTGEMLAEVPEHVAVQALTSSTTGAT